MMTPFYLFKTAVQRQFQTLSSASPLFTTNFDRDRIWSVYLSAFGQGTNPLFRKNSEHDCSCCRHFLRTAGGIVGIVDNKLVSLWDLAHEDLGRYSIVAERLSAFVKFFPIENIFLHPEAHVGVDRNRGFVLTGSPTEPVQTFDHFHLQLPAAVVCRGDTRGTRLSDAQATHDVLARGLTEITPDALHTVLELIAQGSLYRGTEHTHSVDLFQRLQIDFAAVPATARDYFVWSHVPTLAPSVSRIRNTVIGTLLVDLSTGVDLDTAVRSFETKVAPANYKRPTALVTPAMIERARATLDGLGLLPSLDRRFAVLPDVAVTNVLYADRDARPRMRRDAFDDIVPTRPRAVSKQALDRVEEIHIDDFIAHVLPGATSLEVMFENRHAGNLVSLIAPCDLTAKPLFKWPNNFSWCYNGELTDSIKERVKQAGGAVDVDLRCSLAWYNHDDLDLHMIEPNGYEIFYGSRGSKSPAGGTLDVDMNAGVNLSRTPVENICYPSRSRMAEGTYTLFVYQFNRRETDNTGFEVEIEFNGAIHTFPYAKAMRRGEQVVVATINYSHRDGFKITQSLPSSEAVKTVWGLPTQSFHRVQTVMLSPNYWDGHGVGNKHFFFMLAGCKHAGQARGFFNEFLSSSLDPHRKVLELVGAKMKTEKSDEQLSGLGFSSTQRNSVLCKVQGSFNRTVKITF